MDAEPPAGLGTVDLFEIDQQTTKILAKEGWVRLVQSLFYHVSTLRFFEHAIGFEEVVGVWEVSHEKLGLVEVRLDDFRENPTWRQQTGSSIQDRCLMVLRIGQASGGRRRPGKHVGNIRNHSGKLLPV